MAKSRLKLRARRLRQQGCSIKSIAKRLHVSLSTASLWCRDIELSPAQIQQLEKQARDPYYGRRLFYVKKQQKARREKVQHLLQQGIQDIGNLTVRELLLVGAGLYWAEGFKKDNLVGFANSDPIMLQFFTHWLEKSCKISKNRLRLRVGVNELYRNQVTDIESYWSHVLRVPKAQFQKPFFQKVKWKKTYEHPEDYHGVLRVRIAKSTDLLRKIHGWIEGLKQSYVRAQGKTGPEGVLYLR